MKNTLLCGLAAIALAGCTNGAAPVSATAVTNTLDSIRLFCAVKDSTIALATVSGSTVAPVIARGASSAYLAAACAVAGGFAVAPPSEPGKAPLLVIPATSIPLTM